MTSFGDGWQVVLLLTVIMDRCAHYVIENPISSLVVNSVSLARNRLHQKNKYRELNQPPAKIDAAPRLAAFLAHRVHFRVTTYLGMFGGKTPKPIKLISDDPFIQHLYRTTVRDGWYLWYVYLFCNHGLTLCKRLWLNVTTTTSNTTCARLNT